MPAKRFGSQVDLAQIPVLGLVPESSPTASPPANAVNGQIWFDTTLGRLLVREAGSWVLASQTGSELLANKGASGGYASLDGTTKVPIAQIPTGTTGSTVPFGNDARFTDSRTPSGTAGGVLAGTYPNPTLAANGITTNTPFSAAMKDSTAATAMLRSIGTGALQAMAGNTTLSSIAAATADINLGAFRITSSAAPTNPNDYTNKTYVDLMRQGLRLKDAVRAATTANITLSGTQTVDGVVLVANDRVLVKDQTATQDDGIYLVAAGAWTRATDADTAAELTDGTTTFVQEGTANNATTWAQISPVTTLGTSAQNWTQQGAAAAYTAGNGLALTGSDFSVNVDGASLEIVSDIVRVKALGIVGAMLATGSVDLASNKVTGTLPVANGGTGATTAAAARTSLGAVGKYAATLGALAAGSETIITHGLNTTDVQAQFRLAGTGYEEMFSWRVIDVNTIGVTADIAYSASALRVVVMG